MLNKVILIGNLGKDPEQRATASGTTVTKFSVATNEWVSGKDGSPGETRTEWHNIVVFGKLAETCAQHLTKGRLIYVEGRVQTRSWDDQEGRKRYTTEVIAQAIRFLGGRGEASPERSVSGNMPDVAPPSGSPSSPAAEDDIPF